MKIVSYTRCSTLEQAENGQGLQIQEAAIRAWAAKEGHEIVAFFCDAGVSGSNGLESRVGLANALEGLREAKGLVVYRLDRLARDLVVQETVLGEVKRMGALVFSTSEAESGFLGDEPSDPSRKLIRQVLGAVSEYERAMIRLRLEAGRTRKRAEGGYAGHGSPPFGYCARDGALVPEPSETPALRLMAEMRERGATLREIATALEDRGFKPRRGKCWAPMTIARVLNRETGASL